MDFAIPHPLKAEHEELHRCLANAARESGKIGEAARAVAKLLHPHFEKEERYALPPLALLAPLAAGKFTPEMAAVLPLTEKLRSNLDEMLAEHRAIVATLKRLVEAANAERMPEYALFAEKLMIHAQSEELISYPAALLIGEYIKLRFGRRTA